MKMLHKNKLAKIERVRNRLQSMNVVTFMQAAHRANRVVKHSTIRAMCNTPKEPLCKTERVRDDGMPNFMPLTDEERSYASHALVDEARMKYGDKGFGRKVDYDANERNMPMAVMSAGATQFYEPKTIDHYDRMVVTQGHKKAYDAYLQHRLDQLRLIEAVMTSQPGDAYYETRCLIQRFMH